ncbi:hypothetical protein B0H17DRAFT_1212533 [Mycena rosella]|uniref:Uncharacterized protein n=1 Tax=Mycena rosella TaxID=1033263 RepID=A0AAD7CSB7_MYCRO|nr:hypothetical protein B0H17DRAFT_1212533 [Mycena rosella]
MASVPPQVQTTAKDTFEIPQAIYFDILPSKMTTISKVLEFTVPLQCILNDAPQPVQYFSKSAPDVVIRKLVEQSRQAWLDGFQSVMYSHLSGGVVTHFPLWVLTFWLAVVDFKRDVRVPWTKCSDWLAQQKKGSKKNPAREELVDEARQIFSMMP